MEWEDENWTVMVLEWENGNQQYMEWEDENWTVMVLEWENGNQQYMEWEDGNQQYMEWELDSTWNGRMGIGQQWYWNGEWELDSMGIGMR